MDSWTPYLQLREFYWYQGLNQLLTATSVKSTCQSFMILETHVGVVFILKKITG